MTTLQQKSTTEPAALWHGIRTVAEHEIRLRLRAGRWRRLLVAWFLVLLLFTAGLRQALTVGDDVKPLGTPLFGGLLLFQLGLALLVVPALTAQSINGDREHGILATLQVTLLRPVEIALGKLAAAWGAALLFLVLSLPMIGWCMLEGGVEWGRVVVTLLVVALLLGVVCAVAQCLSALLARSTTSAVLSYLTVFALTGGSVIVFGLALAATSHRVTVHYRDAVCASDASAERMPDGTTGCVAYDPSGKRVVTAPVWQDRTHTGQEERSNLVWWLLAPNPFVVLADAAPSAAPVRNETGDVIRHPLDPLGEIGREVRKLRNPSKYETAGYTDDDIGSDPYESRAGGPVWPYGLAADILLAVAAVVATTRRLRTPATTLPRGVRIA